MTNSEIFKAIETQQLRLGFLDGLTHYGIVLYLAVLPTMTVWYVVKDALGYGKGARTVAELTGVGAVGLVLSIIAYFVQRNRLKFTAIPINLGKEDIEEVLNHTAKQLKWSFVEAAPDHAVARRTGGIRTGSWGEQITIIIDKKQILINSICDPNMISSVASFGRNRKNIETFERNIRDKHQERSRY